MSVLQGTNVRPDDVLGQVERNKVARSSETKEYELRLFRWKQFKSTPEGMAISELADPMIQRLTSQLAMSVSSFPNISKPALDEIRAEWRGALSVWVDIKFQSDLLKQKLDEIAEFEKEKEVKKEGGWFKRQFKKGQDNG